MVVKTEMKNKKGEVLKTKEGQIMYDYKFEAGDEFIPQHNSLMKKTNQAVVEGKKKTITNHKLKVIVRNYNNNEPIYVSLTPSQANTFNKKIENEVILNQNLFCAYIYTDKDENEWIGVGFKPKNTTPKTFDELDELDEVVEEQ